MCSLYTPAENQVQKYRGVVFLSFYKYLRIFFIYLYKVFVSFVIFTIFVYLNGEAIKCRKA